MFLHAGDPILICEPMELSNVPHSPGPQIIAQSIILTSIL